MRLPPQPLQRNRWPALGTVIVSGKMSTLTSASRPQASHLAVTTRTPFWRMLASVIGGPKLLRIVLGPIFRRQVGQGGQRKNPGG
jgi:hypothetical protein